MYSRVVRKPCTLQRDPSDAASTHLAPRVTITISLTMCPVPKSTSPGPFCDYQL